MRRNAQTGGQRERERGFIDQLPDFEVCNDE